MTENDAPFSRAYEDYRLSGFDTEKTYGVVDRFATYEEVFSNMKAFCPWCTAPITHLNLVMEKVPT